MLDLSSVLSSNTLLNQGLREKHSHHGTQYGKCGKRCSAGEVQHQYCVVAIPGLSHSLEWM